MVLETAWEHLLWEGLSCARVTSPPQAAYSRSTADFGFSLEFQGQALRKTQDLRAEEETESLRNMR